MSFALGNVKNSRVSGFGRVGASEFIDKPVLFVDPSAPISAEIAKRLRLAYADVPVALYILDEGVDAFQRFLVFKLPAGILVPGAGRKCNVHDIFRR